SVRGTIASIPLLSTRAISTAVRPTPQAVSHGPTTIPDTPSDLPSDPPGSEPLLVATDTPLPSVAPSNVAGRTPAIKATSPPFYNGDHTQGRQFLTACLYIGLNRSSFTDPSVMICWTLSYMNAGRAADLAQEILEAPTLRFLDWPSFETWFLVKFTHANEVQHTALVLEGTSYHQQGRALDTYIDKYKKLVRRSDFPHSTQLVLRFCRGLDQSIRRCIDGMVEGRPRDDDLNSWISIARLIDQNAECFTLPHHIPKLYVEFTYILCM
ncbi:hypothetical protein H0H92_013152, partial [Tricholoma furcatifolium]